MNKLPAKPMTNPLANIPRLFVLLSALFLACPAQADEIELNSIQTPDAVGAFYIDDLQNSGEVSGPPQGHIGRIDQLPYAIQVGDIWRSDLPGRIRKNFLLFSLPELQGKTVKQAILHLYLSEIKQEGPAKLPPAFVFHAETWDDGAWSADPRFLGLQTSDYADVEKFSTKRPLCGTGDTTGASVDIDVTDMIRSDYRRNDLPVAVFRLEVADQQVLDISDTSSNFYAFPGPGLTQMPEKTLPSLRLTLE
jgi:hypothetical protein